MLHLVFITFLFIIGLSCCIWPHSVQKFAIRFNVKFGHVEPKDSFRNSEMYILRLRKLGMFVVGSVLVIVMMYMWSEELGIEELGIYVFEKLVN